MAISLKNARIKAVIVVISIINMLTGLAMGGVAVMVHTIPSYLPQQLVTAIPEVRTTVGILIGVSALLIISSLLGCHIAIYRKKFKFPLDTTILAASIAADIVVVALVITLKLKGQRFIGQSEGCENCEDLVDTSFKFVDPALGLFICVLLLQVICMYFTCQLTRKRVNNTVEDGLAHQEEVFEIELEKQKTRMSRWMSSCMINNAITESTNLMFNDMTTSIMGAVRSSRESLLSGRKESRTDSLPSELDRHQRPRWSLAASQPDLARHNQSSQSGRQMSVSHESIGSPCRFSHQNLSHSRGWVSSPAMTSVWSTPGGGPCFSPPMKDRFVFSGGPVMGTAPTYWRYVPAPLPVQVPPTTDAVFV